MKTFFVQIFQKFALIIFFGLINLNYGNAQNSQKSILKQNIVPHSPEASAFAKYIDVPVSPYTGVPNINIPITSISAGDLSLPISLSYHASGLKVDEVASWVGAGWSLNAGGMISRNIRGRADELGGYYNSSILNEYFNITGNPNELNIQKLGNDIANASSSNPNPSALTNITTLERGCIDAEPDIFFMTSPKSSGKFLFDRTFTPVFFPRQNIKITKDPFGQYVGNGGGGFGYWEVVDEEGYTYIFGRQGDWGGVETSDVFAPIYPPPALGNIDCSYSSNRPTGWMLAKVVSPNGQYLAFSYEQMQTVYQSVSESDEQLFKYDLLPTIDTLGIQDLINPYDVKIYTHTIKGFRLSKIESSTGQTIEFLVDNRLDLAGGKRLSEIKEYYKNTLIKSYKLYHSYFGITSGSLSANLMSFWAQPEESYTLKLDSLKQFNTSNESLPAHKFFYEGDSRPHRKSRSQDHWGYYNGADNGDSMLPEIMELYTDRGLPTTHPNIAGANRDPNFEFAKLGILTKIIYPTGGNSQFEYESNNYSSLRRPEFDKIRKTFNFVVNTTQIKESEVFIINNKSPFTNVKIRTTLAPCGNTNTSNGGGIQADCYINLVRVDANGIIILTTFNADILPVNLLLPSGTYKLVGKTNGQSIGAFLEWTNAGDTLINKTAGGLRVKKVTLVDDKNNTPPIIKEYDYSENEAGKSSGRSIWVAGDNHIEIAQHAKVNFSSLSTGVTPVPLSCDPPAIIISFINRITTSSSATPNVGNSGVGYGKVTIKQTSQKKDLGKVVSLFHNPLQSEDINETLNPFGLSGRFGETSKYGSPLQQIEYKRQNDIYIKQKESQTKYDSLKYNTLTGFKVFQQYRTNCPFKKYDFLNYRESSEWYYPAYTKSIVYDDNQKAQTTEEFFEYDFDIQKVVKKRQKLSSSEEIVQTFKYPKHYAGDPDAVILNNNNMIGVPLKEETWKIKSGLQTKISGKRLKNLTTTGNPQEIWVYENQNLLQIPVGQQDNSGELAYYQNKANFEYLGDKLVYQQAAKDIPQSYIWGYLQGLPIAQIINAKSKDVFYTSFEEWGHGNDDNTNAKTGRKSKINGFSKSLSNLTPGNYELTYWQLNNGAWTLQKNSIFVDVDGIYEINLTGQIDEVRFYPLGASMTTYTYDPLIGTTSITDPNNQTIYYEYDGFGRLKWVKDFQGNILKQNEYFYRQD